LVENRRLEPTHLYLAPRWNFARSSASENWNHGLTSGVICVILCLAISIQCRPLIDGRADTRRQNIGYRASITSRGKNQKPINSKEPIRVNSPWRQWSVAFLALKSGGYFGANIHCKCGGGQRLEVYVRSSLTVVKLRHLWNSHTRRIWQCTRSSRAIWGNPTFVMLPRWNATGRDGGVRPAVIKRICEMVILVWLLMH